MTRRAKIPPTRRPPDRRFVPETCETCAEKRKQAERPSLDPLSLRQARNVLEAVPPYGPKIRLRHRGVSMVVCPRCDSFPNPKGDDFPPIPVIEALGSRAERRSYGRSQAGRR